MKIRLYDASRLFGALSALSQERMPFQTARVVAQMRTALQPEQNLLAQEEYKLAMQHHGKIEDGRVCFPSAEDSAAFRAAQEELHTQEIDVPLVMLRLPDTICMTPSDAAALECILEVDET